MKRAVAYQVSPEQAEAWLHGPIITPRRRTGHWRRSAGLLLLAAALCAALALRLARAL